MNIPSAAPSPPDRPPYLPKQLPLDHPACQVLTKFASHWAVFGGLLGVPPSRGEPSDTTGEDEGGSDGQWEEGS